MVVGTVYAGNQIMSRCYVIVSLPAVDRHD